MHDDRVIQGSIAMTGGVTDWSVTLPAPTAQDYESDLRIVGSALVVAGSTQIVRLDS